MLANLVLVLKSNCRYSLKYSSQYMEALFCKVLFFKSKVLVEPLFSTDKALVEGRFLNWNLCASSNKNATGEHLTIILYTL